MSTSGSSSQKNSGNEGAVPGPVAASPPLPTPTPPPLPSCTNIFDRFWYCASPGSQFNHYYHNGDIEYCPAYLNDWTTCLKAQLVLDDARKRQIMSSTSVMQPNPTPNTILVLKEKPGWAN